MTNVADNVVVGRYDMFVRGLSCILQFVYPIRTKYVHESYFVLQSSVSVMSTMAGGFYPSALQKVARRFELTLIS